MRFPNLQWAIRENGMTNYRAAAAKGESAFSRAVRGRAEFTTQERTKLASLLNYPEAWLFQEIFPPASGRMNANE